MTEQNLEGPVVELGFSSPMTEQEVRFEIVQTLIVRGTHIAKAVKIAEPIVQYILTGKVSEADSGEKDDKPARVIKKIPVFLPGQGNTPFERVRSQAWLLKDGHIAIEFEDPQKASDMFHQIDDTFEDVTLSFNYRPAHPENSDKEA